MLEYRLETGNPPILIFEVFRSLVPKPPLGVITYASIFRAQVDGDDPWLFFDKLSKRRFVVIELFNGTYARAYVKDYPGTTLNLPTTWEHLISELLYGARLAKSGAQFSVPVLYDISPRGIEPYILHVYDFRREESFISSNYTYGVALWYKGKIVSFYAQSIYLRWYYVPRNETIPSPWFPEDYYYEEDEVCWTERRENLVEHWQENFQQNPDGTYYTEVWGLYEIVEVDCNGNVNIYYEERLMYVVTNGYGTYSNADPNSGEVCGANEVKVNEQTGEVECQ